MGSLSNDTSNIIQDAFKDSNSVKVNNSSLFAVGDWVRIIQNDGVH